MTAQDALSLGVAAAFAAVHVFGGLLGFLRDIPRSAWLSMAGGVSVAYVFVHVLPELARSQRTIGEKLPAGGWFGAVESHSYLIALAGLALFYGLERLAKSRPVRTAPNAGRHGSSAVFWIHVGSYATYNTLIGYLLLHREEADLRGLAIYAVAMGLHFVVNDHGLRVAHGAVYHAYGRWALAAAPLLGWLVGWMTDIPALATSALFAFLAGSVVLNVLKEELPEYRESRFWAFGLGCAAYAALLMVTR